MLSEVGEQLLKQAQHEAETKFADAATVDAYINSIPDEWLECREGRHDYPTVAQNRRRVPDLYARDGQLVTAPVDCRRCGMAYREFVYEIVGRGKNARLTKKKGAGGTKYHLHKLGPNGESYLAEKGSGRITSLMIHEALMTEAMGGMTAAQIRKRAEERALELKAEKEIAAAARKAERLAEKEKAAKEAGQQAAPAFNSAAS